MQASRPTPPPIVFAIIGTGWRSEFFLRVARALPDRLAVCGLVARREESRRHVENEWGLPAFSTLDALLDGAALMPDFVLVSVPRAAAPEVIASVVERGLPVLTETPPAETVEAMAPLVEAVRGGARIQVAEQYHLQPLLSAQIAIAASGQLGEISQAQLSVAHDYHGVSLMRRMLGIRFENATITAQSFASPVTAGPTRAGAPTEDRLVTATQQIARFDFGAKLGITDFTDEQYFSWILSNRVLVRGTRGEIVDDTVTYLADADSPLSYRIERVDAGRNTNLEGYHLIGLRSGQRWLQRNEFAPARLADDELAIAGVLARMGEYSRGGPAFYGLAEAAQDHYLALMAARSASTGQTVVTSTQSWADLPEGA